MKGIVLAGGRATRLYPITRGVCKQLLPVYDKPMIYYPLSVLLMAGIREILIISTPKDTPRFQDLLGTGSELGVKFGYAVQDEPRGIAESFIIGERFIAGDSVALILGDNIFYGHNFSEILKEASAITDGALIFGYYVKDPRRYGVVDFDSACNVVCITEKPEFPRTNWAVAGLYFYDPSVTEIALSLRPSAREELEITDVNNEYIRQRKLKVKFLGRGYAWLDTGTYDSLIDASLFIKTIEDRQGLKIGCIEEIAYRMGFIAREQLVRIADEIKTPYGEYLRKVCDDEI